MLKTKADVDTTCDILLVEDNPGDARLVEEAMDSALVTDLCVVSNGDDAIEFLYQHGEYKDVSLPHIVLLDWKLPGIDGKDVLTRIRDDPERCHLPVVVLTGVQSDTTVREIYRAGANACIPKTSRPADFEEALRRFQQFWLSTARLPQPQHG